MYNSGFYINYSNSWLRDWRDHLPSVVSSQYRMNSLIYERKPKNIYELTEDYVYALWENKNDKKIERKVYHLGSGQGLDVMMKQDHPIIAEYKKLLDEYRAENP